MDPFVCVYCCKKLDETRISKCKVKHISRFKLERKKEGESSLQSKHEGKMVEGSSPRSCKPMQVRRLTNSACTREVSMNRQLHPTTSPPGLDRRELFFFSFLYTSCPLHQKFHPLILELRMSMKTTQRTRYASVLCCYLCVSWIIGELSARIAWGWSALYRAEQQIWSVGSVLGPLAYMDKKLALFPCQ